MNNYVYLDLASSKLYLEEPLFGSGICLIYVHSRNITTSTSIDSLLDSNKYKQVAWKKIPDEPGDYTILLSNDDLFQINEIYGTVRKIEDKLHKNNKSLIVIIPGVFHDIIEDRSMLSVMAKSAFLAYIHPDIHTDNNFHPWSGNSWLSEGIDNCRSKRKTLEACTTLETLNHQFNNLIRHRLTANDFTHRGTNASRPNAEEISTHYLHQLELFLPRYKEKRLEPPDWLFSNMSASTGGAITFTGVFNLPNQYIRDLFLEGWLTLWEDVSEKGTYWLQPASLALMYWTAWKSNRPYTDSVKSFLDAENYHWTEHATWFGGKWSGRLTVTEPYKK